MYCTLYRRYSRKCIVRYIGGTVYMTLFTLQRTVNYTVHFTEYTSQCLVHSTVYTRQYSVHFTLCSVSNTIQAVHYAGCSGQCLDWAGCKVTKATHLLKTKFFKHFQRLPMSPATAKKIFGGKVLPMFEGKYWHISVSILAANVAMAVVDLRNFRPNPHCMTGG